MCRGQRTAIFVKFAYLLTNQCNILMEVQVKEVSKSYGAERAVNNLSFELKAGEILGFLGPNGAGKTTMMKMMAHYMEIESGDILVGNQSMRTHGEELKKHIGYLPENNPLYLDMPVIEYLSYCAKLQGVEGKLLTSRLREMVEICGIQAEKHKKIGELSKGYRQRVGLAQAMIHNPDILILDEPTTGLDPNQIVEIRNLIRNLGREKTVILSTHILPEVEATCDRILIINRGEIVADGTADSLKKQAGGTVFYRVRIGDADTGGVAIELRKLKGVERVDPLDDGRFEVHCQPDAEFPKTLFSRCAEKGWYIAEIKPFETSLENVFQGLTS